MKKYRLAKYDTGTKLWMLQQRICLIFWMDLTRASLTSFYFVKNEEYQMNDFLKRFGLLICTIFGGCSLIFAYVVLVPIIGDWIKSLDVDGKLITLCVIVFFVIVRLLFHFRQKQADEDWLTRDDGEELGYYRNDD